MGARLEVKHLVSMGQLPPEPGADPAMVDEFHRAIKAIYRPVSTEEAGALLTVFGSDSCYGVAWTLLHLIETAPESPLKTEPSTDANEWIKRLWERAHR